MFAGRDPLCSHQQKNFVDEKSRPESGQQQDLPHQLREEPEVEEFGVHAGRFLLLVIVIGNCGSCPKNFSARFSP
jgi:hypothetical protein